MTTVKQWEEDLASIKDGSLVTYKDALETLQGWDMFGTEHPWIGQLVDLVDRAIKAKRLFLDRDDIDYRVNPSDLELIFWRHTYLVTVGLGVGGGGTTFLVNAIDEHHALDYIIDYCEEHLPGLVSDGTDLDDDELEDCYQGGNHGVYLHSTDVVFETLR